MDKYSILVGRNPFTLPAIAINDDTLSYAEKTYASSSEEMVLWSRKLCSSFHNQTHAVFNIAALNAFSIIHCTAAETATLLHDVFLQFCFYTNSQNERFQSRKGYNFYLTEHNSTKASKPLVCLTFLVPKSTDAFSFSIRKT